MPRDRSVATVAAPYRALTRGVGRRARQRAGSVSDSPSVPLFHKRLRNGSTLVRYGPPLPSSAIATYVTVKEAARLTGKSASSIRRIIYPIVQNDDHPDRGHIQPSIEDARTRRMNGATFAWRLSEELLRRTVKFESAPGSGPRTDGGSRASGDGYGELLAMLRRELDIKNSQITQQMEVINGLSERVRESNILLGNLQQRFALTDGRDSKAAELVKPKTVVPAKAEKPEKPEKGTATATKTAKPKKGFLSRLFR